MWGRSLVSAQGDARPTVSFARDGAGGTSALDTYCATCHNDALRSASGTLLIRFNGTHSTPEMWARAYRQLQANAMPPVGSPRPADFNASLRDAMAKETELFLLSQLRDAREPIDLWTADYTFLNEQLAKHYRIAAVTGPQFRRVTSTPVR